MQVQEIKINILTLLKENLKKIIQSPAKPLKS